MSLEEVKLDFEVVTPMFLGGASPNAEAELRPPKDKFYHWTKELYYTTGKVINTVTV